MIKLIKIKLQLEIERDDDGFHVYCIALKGLHVDGATEMEAIESATMAANAYIASLIKHDEPLPVGCNVSEFRMPFLARIKSLMPRRTHLITTEVACAA
jgi:predicted RNase H-like HicB family nuclease